MTSSLLTFILAAGALLVAHRQPHQLAMRAAVSILARPPGAPAMVLLARSLHPPGSEDSVPRRPRTLFAPRDPLAKHRAVTGKRARIRWWEKMRAVLGLVVMVAFLGALLAVVVGLLFFGARISVEFLAD